MKGKFLVSSNEVPAEGNIYADRSALILSWLLRKGRDEESFTLRKVAKDAQVSLGLVQRVFKLLVSKGILQTEGIRTSKRFFLKKPTSLLTNWLDQYSIVKKCKMWTYHSSFQQKEELFEILKKSNLQTKTALALHSAAEAYGCKNTNLNTLELYLLDPTIRKKLESILQLEPQEKGYEILLIEPYYKSLLNPDVISNKEIKICSPLLTFLDLYHFPLRGQEQAEFMAERIPEIKHIYKNG